MKITQIFATEDVIVTKATGKHPAPVEAASNLALNSFSFAISLRIFSLRNKSQ